MGNPPLKALSAPRFALPRCLSDSSWQFSPAGMSGVHTFTGVWVGAMPGDRRVRLCTRAVRQSDLDNHGHDELAVASRGHVRAVTPGLYGEASLGGRAASSVRPLARAPRSVARRPRSAEDGELARSRIEERPLDDDLPSGEE